MAPLRTDWQRKRLALECNHKQVQRAADEAERFAGSFYAWRDGQKLILAGETGSGKTHIAKALYRWANDLTLTIAQVNSLERTPSSTFLPWPECVQAAKEGQQGTIQDAKEVDLLILDDMGAEIDPWKGATDTLCQILSRRERRYTVITTNIPPESWADRWDARVADRLCRSSVIVDMFEVPSFATI